VPFLEKASLEEPGNVLIDRWADLLVSGALDPSSAHPRFVQILSELTGTEVMALRNLALNRVEGDKNTSPYSPDVWRPEVVANALKSQMLMSDNLSEISTDLRIKAAKHLSRNGVAFVDTSTVIRNYQNALPDTIYPMYPIFSLVPPEVVRTTSLLSSLSLVRECAAHIPDERFVVLRVDYVCLTPLGVEFLITCDRELAEVLRPSA
jgi:hypothetical protein